MVRLITRSSDVIYSEIANFENYVNFIPSCSSAQLIEKNDDFEIGKLEFNFLIRNYSEKFILDKELCWVSRFFRHARTNQSHHPRRERRHVSQKG